MHAVQGQPLFVLGQIHYNNGVKQKMTKQFKHGEELRKFWREEKRRQRAKKKEAETK